jgi:predicted ATPase/transcriptional regulator with XRE-family HTH domain/Tfp pilus assembly protein PilF
MEQAAQAQFGTWLKQQRKSRRRTQEDLAERLACSSVLVQKIEAGERTSSTQLASLIGDWLDIPHDDRHAFLDFARGQLDSREAETKFGYARSASSSTRRLGNFPTSLTPLIGRVEEVQMVERLLSSKEVRLLTLTGPPGIGKTRLALQVAQDVMVTDHFRDGVFFVGLASTFEPDLVPATIAHALDMHDTSSESLLINLQHKQVLLLLDNFEQVLDASPVVLELLGGCPNLKVMTTSREALYIYGEQQFHVPPLTTADPAHLPPIETLPTYPAISLFMERARAVKPDFDLTEENAGAVAAICARLDGLPLAIELAATHIKMLSAQEMQARLDSRLLLLTGGPRNLPTRQRTLRAAIDWSYNLLNGAEQILFARLGVFVGGCTFSAAEAVCNAEHDLAFDVQEGIESLLDKNLLKREEGVGGESRFTMLEMVRDYSVERLHLSKNEQTLESEHALYLMRLAEEAELFLMNTKQHEWFNRLEDEHDNIRAALRWVATNVESTLISQSTDAEAWVQPKPGIPHPIEIGLRIAGAIWRFWQVRGYLSEGREKLQGLLSQAALLPQLCSKEAKARALNGAGTLAYRQGNHLAALSLLEDALALGNEVADKKSIALSLTGLGSVATEQGDYPAARSFHEQSLTLRRELGDKNGIANSLNNLGVLAFYQGDYPAAGSLYEQSLALRRELGDKNGIANSLNNLGLVASETGDYPSARSMHEQSLALMRELGDTWGVAYSISNLGTLAYSQGDYSAARSLFLEGLALGRELENKRAIAISLNNLGNVTYMQEDYPAAHSLYVESLQMRRELGDNWGMALSLAGLGAVAVESGQAQRGARQLGASDALHEAIGVVMEPDDRIPYDFAVASARAQLGEAAFEKARQEGRAMNLEQAIEYALEGV